MRKSTILMISVVFIASVLIVGIFGMNIFSIGKVNYVKEIVLDSESFVIDNAQAQTNFQSSTNQDGTKKFSYLIITKKDVAINLTITPTLIPTLQDVELTDPTISTVFTHNNPENAKSTYENGVFTMTSANTGSDSFIVTLKTNDGSNIRVNVTVMVIFTA